MEYTPEKKYHALFVVLLIAVLHTALGLYKVIPLRPQSIHQWAQCDRASVALNYYHDGMNFFLPRVHNVDNGTGITGLEFPFVNYTAAILYKIFGFHEWMYRFLSLFIYSIGLYAAFKIAYWWLKNFWQSVGIMLIFGCSPLLAYFSANFLPEPSALGFSLMAWYLFLKFIDTREKKWCWYWCATLSLASLIKLSALINVPAMLLLVWINSDNEQRKKLIPNLFFKVCIIVGLTFSWYRYAMWLSTQTRSEIFLLQAMLPKNWKEFIDVWKEMRAVWFNRIYCDILLVVMLLSLVIGLIVKNVKQKQLYLTGGVLFLSALAFLFSMWTQLQYHDYYMINMYPVFLFGLILSVNLLNQIPGKITGCVVIALFLGAISFQFYESKTHVRTCFKKDSWKYSPLHFDQFFDFNAILRNAGVKPEDRIISIFDHTPDTSLYLMDQKGVTVSYHGFDRYVEGYLKTGMFSYVIYNKASDYDGSVFSPEKYPLELVNKYGEVSIYRITSNAATQHSKTITPAYLSPWN